MSGLLNPGQLPSDGSVPPIVGLTPPIPYQQGNMKYYYLDTVAASILRTDGMKITFRHKIAKTDNKADHHYLDQQIALQAIPYLRPATEEEAHTYEMTVNPIQTIRADVKAEVSSMLQEELAEARVKSAEEARAEVLKKLEDAGVEIPEELLQSLKVVDKTRPQLETDTGGRIGPADPSQNTAFAALQRLKTGGVEVTLTRPTGGGIVNTDDLGGNQA